MNSIYRCLSYYLTASTLLWCTALSVPPPSCAQMIQVGEVLEYEVSYLGILLGTIKMTVERTDTLRGSAIVKARADIDTAPGIPFIELHSVFETWMDASVQHSHQFLASTKTKDGWEYTRYDFLTTQNKILVEEGLKNTKYKEYEILSPKRWNDGLSLFFFAREFLKSGRYVNVPTVINGDTSRTLINFRDVQREVLTIAAIKYPVRTVYFKGEARWKGIYGLEKDFEGWFSDDEARIPIRAKMKVIIGKVDIQLVRWKRANWSPPQGL
ncbi:MAG: DUF3108 domain-containing protein [Bacteroidota bacterium]|nr:DUF3108 domain-containing protein [Candidatus Kapabacteria bacterium]MDW8220556.1 DUF3108 domain-containing protein [Bacteroidota bacterium]